MKLNWPEDRENGHLVPFDFLRFISREQLLDRLISKSVAEAFNEFLIDLKIMESLDMPERLA